MNYIRFLYQVRKTVWNKFGDRNINFCEEEDDAPFWHLKTCVILKSYVGIVHPRIETVGKTHI